MEWTTFAQRHWMQRAREYHNLGFHVTVVVTDEKVPTYEQAKAYYQFAVSQPGLKEAIDRWEINNEPNLAEYWTGTPWQYVNNVLKPAYEVLKANGETVIGAAMGTFADHAIAFRDAGYLNYVDFANYHPYGANADEQIARIEQVKKIFAGKPITLTEWNIQTWGLNYESWAAEVNKSRAYILKNVESAFYYHVTYNGFTDNYAALLKPDADRFVANGRVTQMVDGWTTYPAA
jgi:Glycosyl hydrolase catalytic core